MNKKIDRFLKNLSTLTNKHAPIKKRSRKEINLKDKPWINSRIQKMMRIRDKVLLKLKKNATDDYLNLYKNFTNPVFVFNEIKRSKVSYFYS